jgi:hypothetical protein
MMMYLSGFLGYLIVWIKGDHLCMGVMGHEERGVAEVTSKFKDALGPICFKDVPKDEAFVFSDVHQGCLPTKLIDLPKHALGIISLRLIQHMFQKLCF